MKPVYKCDYCSFMGTEEEVKEHEPKCTENYDMRSCYTCKNRGKLSMEGRNIKYECKAGKNIPSGNIYQYCDLYERKEKSEYKDLISGIFGGLYGK